MTRSTLSPQAQSGRILVWLLFVLFPLLIFNSQPAEATSLHTITIDGTNDFTTNEDVPGTSGATWYFTWDATHFYFGLDASDVSSGSATRFVTLYLDTDPQVNPATGRGTTNGVLYNTQQPTLPFNADYHFRWKADNSYTNMLDWNNNTSSWTDDNTGANNFGIAAFQSGTYLEASIPRASLGNPNAVYVAGAMINEVGFGEYTFFMTPNTNTEGNDADFTHYFGFPLKAGLSPDDPDNVDTVPVAVSLTAPSQNALNVPTSTNIDVTFTRAVDSSTVNASTFTVRGQQTASYGGSFTFPAGNQAQFNPTNLFKPGEELFVTLNRSISASDNSFPLAPYTWQFAAATQSSTGQFVPHPTTPSFGTGNSFRLALGDLDNDGDLDVVVANWGNEAETVWLNDGNGNFTAAGNFGAGDSIQPVLGDLDGDNDLDVIVANTTNQAETVWLNNGTGSFTPHPTMPSFGGSNSYGIALGDIDGDGDLDAIVANTGNQAATVWVNDSTGVFTPHPVTPNLGANDSGGVVLGDIDGDGDLDALIANEDGVGSPAETVWRNDGAGNFTAFGSFGAESSYEVVLGDIDGDGDLDALVANWGSEAEAVWLNNGAGAFTPHPTTPNFGTGDSFDVALGDIDGDGDLDALVANFSAEAETVWVNDGAGSFNPHPSIPSFGAGESYGVALGDIDGDGDLDALIANYATEAETVWLNQIVVTTCGLVEGNTYTFSPTQVQIAITTLGSLSCLQVREVNNNHPNATVGIQTGRYWIITPTGSGYTVNMTLPATAPDVNDKVCRYTGVSNTWDCAYSSHTINTITRNGITQLSDWAVGNNVGPTAITLNDLKAQSANDALFVGIIGIVILVTTGLIFLRHKRHPISEMKTDSI